MNRSDFGGPLKRKRKKLKEKIWGDWREDKRK